MLFLRLLELRGLLVVETGWLDYHGTGYIPGGYILVRCPEKARQYQELRSGAFGQPEVNRA